MMQPGRRVVAHSWNALAMSSPPCDPGVNYEADALAALAAGEPDD